MSPDQLVDVLTALTAEFAAQRFTAASNGVTAEVDGTGVLLRITVTDDAMRGAHPERIGSDAVTAVTAARAAATTSATPRLAEAGLTA